MASYTYPTHLTRRGTLKLLTIILAGLALSYGIYYFTRSSKKPKTETQEEALEKYVVEKVREFVQWMNEGGNKVAEVLGESVKVPYVEKLVEKVVDEVKGDL